MHKADTWQNRALTMALGSRAERTQDGGEEEGVHDNSMQRIGNTAEMSAKDRPSENGENNRRNGS